MLLIHSTNELELTTDFAWRALCNVKLDVRAGLTTKTEGKWVFAPPWAMTRHFMLPVLISGEILCSSVYNYGKHTKFCQPFHIFSELIKMTS